MDLLDELQEYSNKIKELVWEGSFKDYLDIVITTPSLSRLAHKTIYDMVTSYGVIKDDDGNETFTFLNDELFGIDDALKYVMEYLKGASIGSEVGKRILMLYGPPSSGKSQLAVLLKRGLECYTQSESGAVYAISECPQHENPLHLIPLQFRKDFLKYNIKIEGELCPVCNLNLKEKYHNKIYDVPVKRIFFSEKDRVGIGTFLPQDPKCVTHDTILFSNLGIITFAEIQKDLYSEINEFRKFKITVDGKEGLENTSMFYNNGIQHVNIITTKFNYEIGCTDVHPLLVLENSELRWKRAIELKVGDYVGIKRKSLLFGNIVNLKKFDKTNYSVRGQYKNAIIPEIMTSDLAKIMGSLIADGNIDRNAIWFTNSNKEIIDEFVSLFKKVFNVEAKVYDRRDQSSRRNVYNVVISSFMLSDFFLNYLELQKGAYNKDVPYIIRVSTKENIIAFLEGLFWGDGSISTRRNTSNMFGYGSVSKNLVKQVQAILLNLGIISSFYVEKMNYNGNYCYSIKLRGDTVNELLTLIPSLKNKNLDEGGFIRNRDASNWDIIPELQPLFDGIALKVRKNVGPIYKTPLKKYYRYTYGNSDKNLNKRFPRRRSTILQFSEVVEAITDTCSEESNILKTLARNASIVWLPIQNIEDGGYQQVYDLTVPKSHSFVANGFINHNSQDISELVGSIDLAKIGEYGAESDPRAYRFDGELNIANRGVIELIEMLKADEKFLYVLLTLCQEKNIKTGRFPLIYADEMIIAHTNEGEFNDFLSNKKSEALRDRMIMVRMPYTLQVSAEEKIYNKLLKQSNMPDVHIAPHTLNIAAMFAILTRLEEAPTIQGLSLIKKMQLYDGQEDVEGFRQKDVKNIKEQFKREGMEGISPRFIINRLVSTISKSDIKCVNPIDALRSIKEGFVGNAQLKKEDEDRLNSLISEVRTKYDEISKEEIQEAFFVSFENEIDALLSNYLIHAEAFLDKSKVLDEITGEEKEHDEALLRRIEEKVPVSESGKTEFRNEILRKVGAAKRKGTEFNYKDHAKLSEGLKKELFEERKDLIQITVSARNPDENQLRKINEVVDSLVKNKGYCGDCGNELLKYVSSIFSREK